MAKIWEDYKHYKSVRAYGDLTTRSCQRCISVEGLENIPKDGAVILAPNHCAALMDPMMILAAIPGVIAFGARSDIFKKPSAARALRWLRIVPIARERNGLAEVAKNFEIFDEIVECLEHDVPFCLFSEGMHRAERGMMPVKKGIFRLAKMAVDRLGKKVYVVPVGLDYEDFFQGQRRTAVRVGEAIEIGAAFKESREENEAVIYRELCVELRERILTLIGRIPERRHDRKWLRLLGAVVSLPLFAVCAVGSVLIWLPHLIIMSRIKDKAWNQTVRYVMHLIFPVFWPFHICFERLLNFYRDLIADFR
jgi:1-acyl-sn-glycerol-3-phosphate acyltransferase